jgi:hypothetical protein
MSVCESFWFPFDTRFPYLYQLFLFVEDGQLWELGLVGKGHVSYLESIEPSPLPRLVKSLPNVKFVNVSAGDYHAVAISGLPLTSYSFSLLSLFFIYFDVII